VFRFVWGATGTVNNRWSRPDPPAFFIESLILALTKRVRDAGRWAAYRQAAFFLTVCRLKLDRHTIERKSMLKK